MLPLEEMGLQFTVLNHAEMYYKVYLNLKCGRLVDIKFFLAEMPAQNECSHKENEEAMEEKKTFTHIKNIPCITNIPKLIPKRILPKDRNVELWSIVVDLCLIYELRHTC